MNRRQLLYMHVIAAVITGFALSVVPAPPAIQLDGGDPVASWQASAAFAQSHAVQLLAAQGSGTQDMPTVAPSFNGRGDTRGAGRDDAHNAGRDAGHSTMTLRVKSPTLQGGATREGTMGGAGDSALLQGNVQRAHTNLSSGAVGNPHDLFAAAGMTQTDTIQEKPRPAKIDENVYRGWLSKAHPQFSLKVASVDPIQVLEIKGTWDKADRTLKNLGIPHTTIGSGQLNEIGLSRSKVLVVNCAGTLDRNSLQGIRDFVMRGGYLLTTDWALDNMLRQTFPGYVEWNRGKSRGNVVDAHVVMPDREFFQGTVNNASWKLDDESQCVRVLKPDAVKVLAISHDLASLDPDHQGILAVTFSFGRGKVLHLVGHFDNNSLPLFPRHLPDPAPVIGIGLRQALAANFVLSALERGH